MSSLPAAALCSNLVGFVYPAYMSFKAIESEDKSDDTIWLTYWVVYAFFNILETFSDLVLYWIPFYYAVKLGFLIWLFYPSTRGAQFLYDHVLKEALLKQQERIDTALGHAEAMGTAVKEAAQNTVAGDSKKTQ